MNLPEKVAAKLLEHEHEEQAINQALIDAERMAEQFKDIRPNSYEIPMERFYGLPAFQKDGSSI